MTKDQIVKELVKLGKENEFLKSENQVLKNNQTPCDYISIRERLLKQSERLELLEIIAKQAKQIHR